jgi:hypothetical protein
LPEEARRLQVQLSVSNKDYPRLKRLREAFEAKEGHIPSRDELVELAQSLGYQAIDAYCESVKQEQERVLSDL